jgi:isochorismate hydrolase
MRAKPKLIVIECVHATLNSHRNPQGIDMAVAPRMAMLILDLISDFQYPDAETVIPIAKRISKVIAPLKSRARAAGVPVIYVNDTRGHWESDQHRFIERCLNASADAAQIVTRLMPEPDDYFLFKPRHSAFFATSLPELLGQLNISTLLLTGLTTHQCVLFTAVDAHVRRHELIIASDGVGSPDKADTRHALHVLENATSARVMPARGIRFKKQRGKMKRAS